MASVNPLSSRLPFSLPIHLNHAGPAIAPAVPIRALKRLAKWIPTTTLHNAAIDSINLAGDILEGNRLLREEEACERWRQQRIKELLIAMDQVGRHSRSEYAIRHG